MPHRLQYAEYRTSRSGAYLFRPEGVEEDHTPAAQVNIVTGDLMSEIVISVSPVRTMVLHSSAHSRNAFNSCVFHPLQKLRLYNAPHQPLSLWEVGGVLHTIHETKAGQNREVIVR